VEEVWLEAVEDFMKIRGDPTRRFHARGVGRGTRSIERDGRKSYSSFAEFARSPHPSERSSHETRTSSRNGDGWGRTVAVRPPACSWSPPV
jgi:hypothetical protein